MAESLTSPFFLRCLQEIRNLGTAFRPTYRGFADNTRPRNHAEGLGGLRDSLDPSLCVRDTCGREAEGGEEYRPFAHAESAWKEVLRLDGPGELSGQGGYTAGVGGLALRTDGNREAEAPKPERPFPRSVWRPYMTEGALRNLGSSSEELAGILRTESSEHGHSSTRELPDDYSSVQTNAELRDAVPLAGSTYRDANSEVIERWIRLQLADNGAASTNNHAYREAPTTRNDAHPSPYVSFGGPAPPHTDQISGRRHATTPSSTDRYQPVSAGAASRGGRAPGYMVCYADLGSEGHRRVSVYKMGAEGRWELVGEAFGELTFGQLYFAAPGEA